MARSRRGGLHLAVRGGLVFAVLTGGCDSTHSATGAATQARSRGRAAVEVLGPGASRAVLTGNLTADAILHATLARAGRALLGRTPSSTEQRAFTVWFHGTELDARRPPIPSSPPQLQQHSYLRAIEPKPTPTLRARIGQPRRRRRMDDPNPRPQRRDLRSRDDGSKARHSR